MDGTNEFYDPLASGFGDQEMYQQVQNVDMPSTEEVQQSFDMNMDIDQSSSNTDFFDQVSAATQTSSMEDQMREERMILFLKQVCDNEDSSEQAEKGFLEQAHDPNTPSEQLPVTPQHPDEDYAGEQDRVLFYTEPYVTESPSEEPPSPTDGFYERLLSLTDGSSEQLPSLTDGSSEQLPSPTDSSSEQLPSLTDSSSEQLPSPTDSSSEQLSSPTDGSSETSLALSVPALGSADDQEMADLPINQHSSYASFPPGSTETDLINQSLGNVNFYGRAPPVSQNIMGNPQTGLINQSTGNVHLYAQTSQASQSFMGNPQTGLINQAIDDINFYGQAPPESQNIVGNLHTGLINRLSNYAYFLQGNSRTGLNNQFSSYASFPPGNPQSGLINQSLGNVNYDGQVQLAPQTCSRCQQPGLFDQSLTAGAFHGQDYPVTQYSTTYSNVQYRDVQVWPHASQQPNSAGQGFDHLSPAQGNTSPKKPQRKLLQPRSWDQLWRAQKLSSGGHSTSAAICPVTNLHDWMFRIFAIQNEDLEVTTDRDRQLRDKKKLATATRFMNTLKKHPETPAELFERSDIEAALNREKMYLEKRDKAIVAKERLAERKAAAANTAA
ncbi:hypothetical protein NQ176_g4990 [Zarea fungicola]|uniref:Uncharacterized protein n=1 Tax=Zarea fungicola TaxID=93591 RepID=A0ACC1NAN6_9HYPO|nr:hypothetical protein NQ176_g4990 [Lecanicillium fungicola]